MTRLQSLEMTTEDGNPFTELQIDGDDDAGLFAELADEMHRRTWGVALGRVNSALEPLRMGKKMDRY